jgi:hypothetical protein
MTMSILDMINIAALAIGGIVAFLTLRAGSNEAREFRALTGDDSLIVNLASLGRSPMYPTSRRRQTQADARATGVEACEHHSLEDDLIAAE